jgi:hypothetical protein
MSHSVFSLLHLFRRGLMLSIFADPDQPIVSEEGLHLFDLLLELDLLSDLTLYDFLTVLRRSEFKHLVFFLKLRDLLRLLAHLGLQ